MTNYSLNAIPDTWTHYEHPWYTQLDLLGNTTNLESQSQQKHKSETTGQKSTKKCVYCNQEKPLEEFHRHPTNTTGRDHRCKTCCSKHRREEREASKKAPPAPLKCELCKQPRKLSPDHDHNTLEFRGWLCGTCNKAIGMLGDNIEGLTKAINYLSTNGSQI